MALGGCPELKELKLSGKLTKIDGYAFADTTSAATITFYGSKEKWESVDRPTESEFLKKATMIFDESGEEPEPDIIYGDANCDKAVTVADAVAILQYIAYKDKYDLNETAKRNADVDGTAGVTATDALTIQKVDAGLIKAEDLPLKTNTQ